VSAKLFINVGEYKKAVGIIGKNRDYNWLIDICRNLSKSDNYESI